MKKIHNDRLRLVTAANELDGRAFLSAPGTGKSHLAIALGTMAAQVGHSVYYTNVKRLGTKIWKAREANKLDLLFKLNNFNIKALDPR